MAELRLRAAAASDLADILAYSVEAFGEHVGEAYFKSFQGAFELLRRHPEAGALRHDLDIVPPLRCLPHRRHRIFYDIEGEFVTVVRVLHHAMDAQTWLGE